HQPLGPMQGLPWGQVGKLTSQRIAPSLEVRQYAGPQIQTKADLRSITVTREPQIITTWPFRHQVGIVFDPTAPNTAEFSDENGKSITANFFTFAAFRRNDGTYVTRGSAIVPIVPHVRSPGGYEVLLTSEVRTHNCIESHVPNLENTLQQRYVTWGSDGSRVITFPKGLGRARRPLSMKRTEAFGFPGGTVDPSDPNLAAGAIRELLEESGFVADGTLQARAVRDSNSRRLLNTDAIITNDTYIVQLPRGILPPETVDEGNVLRLKTFTPAEIRFLIDIGELDSIHTTLDPWAFFEDVLRRGRQMHTLGRIQIGYVELVIPPKMAV
ncbi:MAG: NUDIX domain-containing protein, partial [Candidatus Pacebacteria bacterium]|nr:NUDIX domain-containing protein [Candidatus Paceibacterota bacterium]